MSYSQIKIQFLEDLPLNAVLEVNYDTLFDDLPASYLWREKWSTLRNDVGKVTKGTSTSNPGERSAINFMAAFIADYNSLDALGYYVVSRIGNEVTIKSTNPNDMFTTYGVMLGDDHLFSVLFNIDNYEGVPYLLEGISFSQADEFPCTNVKVTVQTSTQTLNVIIPAEIDPDGENPFSFDFLRGVDRKFLIENGSGQNITTKLKTPDALNPNNFNLQLGFTPNGSVAQLTSNAANYGLELEYSIDNEEWKTSNMFIGLAPGDYTFYVRDQLGCSFTKTFTVDEYGVQDSIFYLSKANSIRYAERIDFSIPGNYKTDDNTLSCEANCELPYKEVQQFNRLDLIPTQIKSNFSENMVKVIKPDGSEDEITVEKMTANIGNKEKRDARVYNFGTGKTGIYFMEGYVYNFDTNVSESTFTLYGNVPYWGTLGNYVIIEGIWYKIEQVVFVESKNADVLVISREYFGTDDAAIIVGSIFNYMDYEVYEFTIPMADYENQTIRIRINANDQKFESKIHLSEQIQVKDKHPDTVEVRYRSEDNNDVFYATGISHLMRMQITKVAGTTDDPSEVNKTDTSANLTSSEVYEGDDFTFEPVTKQMMRKQVIALSHEIVSIDGVGYVKNGEIEVEGPLDKSNLYVVKAKLLKTGGVFNIQEVIGNDQLADQADLQELPGLLNYGGGFVKL